MADSFIHGREVSSEGHLVPRLGRAQLRGFALTEPHGDRDIGAAGEFVEGVLQLVEVGCGPGGGQGAATLATLLPCADADDRVSAPCC